MFVCLCPHRNLSLFILMDNVHLHNMSTVGDCQLPNSSDGGALFFFTDLTSISTTSHEPTVSSRQVKVGPLDPRTTTLNSISTNMPRTRSRARDKEEEALANIGHNKRLSQILDLVHKYYSVVMCIIVVVT